MHLLSSEAEAFAVEDEQARGWNCLLWLSRFHGVSGDDAQGMAALRRKCRKEIWHQTNALVRSGRYRGGGQRVITFKVAASGMCLHGPCSRGCSVLRGPYVINDDILSCAQRLCERGDRIAVLNMACESSPGGGVVWGAGAQEENLYRRTDMGRDLEEARRRHYPLNDAALVSMNVTLIRGREEDGYPYLRAGKQVTVISCAAVRHPPLCDLGRYRYAGTREKMRMRIRNMLSAAFHANCDTLLLSAYGCGAYRNPPGEVAEIFSQELSGSGLGTVIFCIKEDHNSGMAWNPGGNLVPFKRVFPEMCCRDSWAGWHCGICGKVML